MCWAVLVKVDSGSPRGNHNIIYLIRSTTGILEVFENMPYLRYCFKAQRQLSSGKTSVGVCRCPRIVLVKELVFPIRKNRLPQLKRVCVYCSCEENGAAWCNDQIPVCSAVIRLPLVSRKSGSLRFTSGFNKDFLTWKGKWTQTYWRLRGWYFFIAKRGAPPIPSNDC